MKACLFNPENDLALAADTASYTPPRNARLLHERGAALPVWYAEKGAQIIARSAGSRSWIEQMCRLYDIDIEAVDRFDRHAQPSPWGWSKNAARQFADSGIDQGCLPSSERLERLRQLSHRRTSVEVLSRLGVGELPCEARTVDEVRAFADAHDSRFYFKSPWSSTGRGVALSTDMPADEVLRRCEGIISRQGSVMLERSLDRVRDFAMLFCADRDGVTYKGLSLFSNEGNAYSGNLLLSDNDIAREIDRLTHDDSLDRLIETMPAVLADVLGGAYCGCFGVDMMVYRDHAARCQRIFPCVEVNLRMTMGVVAHTWRERFLSPDVNARLEMAYRRDETGHSRAVVEQGRLVAGRQSLIVPNSDFSISVVI